MKIVEHISDDVLKRTEKKLLKQPLLKIEGLNPDRVRSKNYAKGIVFLMNQTYRHHTVYSTIDTRNPRWDDIQCHRGARRSQGDLYLIARYYYPELTFKEFREILFDIVSNDYYNTSYCGTINKRVFWRNSFKGIWYMNMIDSEDIMDELGFLLEIED